MAVKTFTNEILTASDTNTYLANAGLVYITSATVGTAVSTVTVSNCFSSTYDSYRIIYTGGTLSSQSSIDLRIGSATANYYQFMVYGTYSSSVVYSSGVTASAIFYWAGGGNTNTAVLDATVYAPYLARHTTIRNEGLYNTGAWAGWTSGVLQDTSQHTDFTLSSVPMTGGTITVYGYRKA